MGDALGCLGALLELGWCLRLIVGVARAFIEGVSSVAEWLGRRRDARRVVRLPDPIEGPGLRLARDEVIARMLARRRAEGEDGGGKNGHERD